MQQRSLSTKEQDALKENTRKFGRLRLERGTASPARRAAIDKEMCELNARCEAIIA